MKINLNAHQVYMDSDEGPFMCKNCDWFVGKDKCSNNEIIKLAKKGEFGLTMKNANFAEVDPEGCSDYFKPKLNDISNEPDIEDDNS